MLPSARRFEDVRAGKALVLAFASTPRRERLGTLLEGRDELFSDSAYRVAGLPAPLRADLLIETSNAVAGSWTISEAIGSSKRGPIHRPPD
jgi:hypothetical protein